MSANISSFEAGKMMGAFEQLCEDFPEVFPVKTLGVTFTKEFLTEFMNSDNCTHIRFNFGLNADQRLTLVLERMPVSSAPMAGAQAMTANPMGGGDPYGNKGTLNP